MPAAATALKNGGNTAVIMVDWNPELAQSYIAQARSSGRLSPMRESKDMRNAEWRIANAECEF
jgi:hypothetical protein